MPARFSFRLAVFAASALGPFGVAVAAPVVDNIGQWIKGGWPGKVHSTDELKADAQNEQAYYEGFHPPARDATGGLPGSRGKLGLNATGYFHVEKKGGKWILVDPEGDAFFHMGVCAFGADDDYTYVAGRESSYAWLPQLDGEFKTAYLPGQGSDVFSFYLANTIRKYGQPYDLDEFQKRMIERVRKFGFNSIGAFSSSTEASHAAHFPYADFLPLQEKATAPGLQPIPRIPGVHETWDPFDPANRAKVESNFAAVLPAKANDPLLLGYFLVNEPLYEDIPMVVPTLKGSQYACKRALVQMLSDKYKTIDAFNAAWGMSAKTFDELNDAPLSATNPAAYADVHDYTGLFFETYFKLVADTFHKYDTHHMLIGNRFQPGTINNEQLCRICGKYVDIVSFNYYTNAIDTDFINRIDKWTGGKPMIFSEFFWGSPRDSGLGDPGDPMTQKKRGLAYRSYVEKAASLGYVVGIEWYTLIDQATTGNWYSKYNGETANTGLFSVADRPYRDCLAGMARTNDNIYDIWLNGRAPYFFDDPVFNQTAGASKKIADAPRATGPITLDGTAANWPGVPPQIVSRKNAGDFGASYRVCWDDGNLYILATIHDPTPMKNVDDMASLYTGDAVEVFFGAEKPDQDGALLSSDRQLVIGAGKPGPAPYLYYDTSFQTPTRTLVVPGTDGKSYIVEVAIPWAAFGTKPQTGQVIRFDIAFDDSEDGIRRRYQLVWNGNANNHGDRTPWGHVVLGN